MKSLFTVIVICFSQIITAQNEFSARAFYADFNKIYEDAQNGFPNTLGKERRSEFPELTKEFTVKQLLPLADSGKLVFTDFFRPYVVYYFEPSKSRLKIDQKGADLREAITIAMNRPVCTRTETELVGDDPVSNTWFFEGSSELSKNESICRISINRRNNYYYLSLQINGNNPVGNKTNHLSFR